VIVKTSKRKDDARAFLEFMKSGAAAELMKRYGFDVPAAKTP